jgi:hypothetical protein
MSKKILLIQSYRPVFEKIMHFLEGKFPNAHIDCLCTSKGISDSFGSFNKIIQLETDRFTPGQVKQSLEANCENVYDIVIFITPHKNRHDYLNVEKSAFAMANRRVCIFDSQGILHFLSAPLHWLKRLCHLIQYPIGYLISLTLITILLPILVIRSAFNSFF